MECNFCQKKLSNKSSLNFHQNNTKYCLEIQGKNSTNNEYICSLCNKKFTNKANLTRHQDICKANNEFIIKLREKLDQSNLATQKMKEQLLLLRQQVVSLQADKLDLQERYDKLVQTMAEQPLYQDIQQAAVIEIETESDDENSEQEYQLTSLDLGKGCQIEHREEDGYINVTNLCKAGGKQLKAWNRLEKTKAFLHVLSSSVLISTDLLIKIKIDGINEERGTWVHPQVAINIAQWISPQFDVKVSAWVYEVMMTGKVDITNTKTYRQIQQENKEKSLRIKHLTKKYVMKQPRLEIKERNVIYILTTKLMKKERRYILGKATNLTNRLSTYNKSDEHEVIYYQECDCEDNMNAVESLVFQKLRSYREQANRERFVLPEGKDISYFVDTIKECISFITK